MLSGMEWTGSDEKQTAERSGKTFVIERERDGWKVSRMDDGVPVTAVPTYGTIEEAKAAAEQFPPGGTPRH